MIIFAIIVAQDTIATGAPRIKHALGAESKPRGGRWDRGGETGAASPSQET